MWMRYRHEHGTVFDNSRRKPWDYFDAAVEFAADEKNPLIRFDIAGNWLSTSVGDDGGTRRHMLAFTQHFEYENTNAYEYGGQSIGPTFFSQWGSWRDFALDTRMDIMATILGAVDSDYSELAVVAEQERVREYDYGPGAGARFDMNVRYHGTSVLSADYRLHFLSVRNGSIYEGDEGGLNAKHWLHGVDVRLDSPPIARHWGVGSEYKSFTRQSHYQATPAGVPATFHVSQVITATTPEILIYAHYNPGGGKKRE
jgi:hypothetical protein